MRSASRVGKRRWAIAAWPTDSWASAVYPKLGNEAAQRRLARDLLDFCRVGPNDPPGVTGPHASISPDLRRRAQRLSPPEAAAHRAARARHRALASRCTRRRAGSGGGSRTSTASEPRRTCRPRSASRRRSRPRPRARSAAPQPLMFQGTLIEEISGEFRGGRLVRLEAKRKAQRDFFADFLVRDQGRRPARRGRARRLELADRPGGPHLLQHAARRERGGAHRVRRRLLAHARRTTTTNRARRGVNQLGRARRRDDRHGRLRGDRHRRARPPRAAHRRRRLADLTSA